MNKVLILTAGFGEGHNAAARGLRDGLELVDDEAKVEVLDLFESSYGAFNTFVKEAYLGLVKYAPGVWGGSTVCSIILPSWRIVSVASRA